MEYSKDIILSTTFTNSAETVENSKGKFANFIKEHKFITLIIISCSMLIVLDYMLLQIFIEILQRI